MSGNNSENNSNNATNNKIIWFLLTTAVTLVLGISMAWGSSVNNAMAQQDARIRVLEQRMSGIDAKLDYIISQHEQILRQRR